MQIERRLRAKGTRITTQTVWDAEERRFISLSTFWEHPGRPGEKGRGVGTTIEAARVRSDDDLQGVLSAGSESPKEAEVMARALESADENAIRRHVYGKKMGKLGPLGGLKAVAE